MKSIIYILIGFFILGITIRGARGDIKNKDRNLKYVIGIIFIIIITLIIFRE